MVSDPGYSIKGRYRFWLEEEGGLSISSFGFANEFGAINTDIRSVGMDMGSKAQIKTMH